MDDDLRRLKRAAAEDVAANVRLARQLALAGRRPEALRRLIALADAPEARGLLSALEPRGEDATPPVRAPSLRWRSPVQLLASFWSSPSGSRVMAIAGAALLLLEQRDRPRVVSLDPRSGAHLWSRTFEDGAQLEVVQDQLVVVGDGRAAVVDAWTGEPLQSMTFAWPAALWPGGDSLAVASPPGETTIYEVPSWRVRARYSLPVPAERCFLALTSWGLIVGVEGEPRSLRALDPSTGAERWRATARTFRALADESGLVSESPDGRLELRGTDGRVRWSVEAPEGWLTLAREAVLVGSSRNVVAFDRVRGERRVVYPWPTEPPLVVAGGTVLVHDPGHSGSGWAQRRGRTSGGDDGFGEAQARSLDVRRQPRVVAIDLAACRRMWELDLESWPDTLQVATLGDLVMVLSEYRLVGFGEARHT